MIVAVDPGKTCGVIAIKDNGQVAWRMEEDAFTTCNRIYETIHHVRPLSLVVERYVITRQVMTQQTDAIEVIGTLRWMCKRDSGVIFQLQSRGDRMRVTSEMLRGLDLWTPRALSPGGHVNEAARHAVIFAVSHDPYHVIAKRALGMMKREENVGNGSDSWPSRNFETTASSSKPSGTSAS